MKYSLALVVALQLCASAHAQLPLSNTRDAVLLGGLDNWDFREAIAEEYAARNPSYLPTIVAVLCTPRNPDFGVLSSFGRSATPYLLAMLDDPRLVKKALLCLSEIRDPRSVLPLQQLVVQSTDISVRNEAIECLGKIELPETYQLLMELLASSEEQIKVTAATVLSELPSATFEHLVASFMACPQRPGHENSENLSEAGRRLTQSEQGRELLCQWAKAGGPLATWALRALSEQDAPAEIELFGKAVRSSDPKVRDAGICGLQRMGTSEAVKILLELSTTEITDEGLIGALTWVSFEARERGFADMLADWCRPRVAENPQLLTILAKACPTDKTIIPIIDEWIVGSNSSKKDVAWNALEWCESVEALRLIELRFDSAGEHADLIIDHLAAFGQASLPLLKKLYQQPDLRAKVIDGLHNLTGPDVERLLADALGSQNGDILLSGVFGCARSKPRALFQKLVKLLDSADVLNEPLVGSLIYCLGTFGDESAIVPILVAVKKSGLYHYEAAGAMTQIPGEKSLAGLEELWTTALPRMREEIVNAYKRIGGPSSIVHLQGIADNPREFARLRRLARLAISRLNN